MLWPNLRKSQRENDATTPNGRTLADAVAETERLMTETFDNLDPDNDRDGWFMVRLTKMREALADRPESKRREQVKKAAEGCRRDGFVM